MSEANIPDPSPMGGPASRPSGEGLPPKTGGEPPTHGRDDAVDPGMAGEGDIGQDTGGMMGEG